MDTDRLRELVAALDVAVPRQGARIRFAQYGGGPDESQVVGNRAGYLRLGIEFLKGGLAPMPAPDDGLPIAIDYLVAEDSSVGFDHFDLNEAEPTTFPAPSPKRRATSALLVLALAAAAFCCIVGAVTIAKAIGKAFGVA